MTTAGQAVSITPPLTWRRPAVVFVFLGFLTAGLMVLNISIGSVSFMPSEIGQVVIHPETGSTIGAIIWKIRIPRAIAAILGGAY